MIPKISILIPAYEDGKRLERLLRSIEEQTGKGLSGYHFRRFRER